MLKNFIKKIRYFFEAVIVEIALWFFSVIGVQGSSNMAAALSKFVGKKLKVNQLAYRNLTKAMPELSEEKKIEILEDMWDNLGRIVGEFGYIGKSSPEEICSFIEVSQEQKQNIDFVRQSKAGAILISGHIGNWEIGPKFFLNYGIKVKTIYRPLNNPYVEKLTSTLRGVELIEKGANGSRQIIETIKNGGFILIMADQKVSEGEPVKFFNHDAITATSVARIALKYGVPIIPVCSVRLGREFKFAVEIEKPLAIERSEDLNFDVLKLTRQINMKLESWIRKRPAQWFWVHDRWKN